VANGADHTVSAAAPGLRPSTRAGLLVGAVAATALAVVVALALGEEGFALAGLAAAVAAAGALAADLIVGERRRHENVEEQNAALLREAQGRETERARLSEQLVSAEQDERRRLALSLHEGPVQSLAGIALMLDAALHSVEAGSVDEARPVITSALERQRETIRSLRDLSFNLEPVVLRDEGFEPAVRALAQQLGLLGRLRIDLALDAGEALSQKAQVTLYQIIREALNQAVRRGPPSRITVRIGSTDDGSIETVIADDGSGERRRSSFETIEERARALSGRVWVEESADGGTALRVVLPAYAART